MSDLNVSIVGLGWVAGAHVEMFKTVERASAPAICSRRDHDEAHLEKEFGTPFKAYTDYQAMLAAPSLTRACSATCTTRGFLSAFPDR